MFSCHLPAKPMLHDSSTEQANTSCCLQRIIQIMGKSDDSCLGLKYFYLKIWNIYFSNENPFITDIYHRHRHHWQYSWTTIFSVYKCVHEWTWIMRLGTEMREELCKSWIMRNVESLARVTRRNYLRIHLFRRFKIHQTQSSPPPLWTVLCQEKLRWTRVWLASLTLSSASVSASSDAVSATSQRNFGEVIYALETCTWSLWNVK